MGRVLRSRVSAMLCKVRCTAAILHGLYNYYCNGQISRQAWMRLLEAHCASNGLFTENLNAIIRILRPPRRPAPVNGLLGHFSVEKQKLIAETIALDGFYIFPNRLPIDLCDQIELFARRTPAVIESNRALLEPLTKYDPEHPVSHTYKIRERDSVENGAIQRLLADEAFIAIA